MQRYETMGRKDRKHLPSADRLLQLMSEVISLREKVAQAELRAGHQQFHALPLTTDRALQRLTPSEADHDKHLVIEYRERVHK
jgi:hypothetical protein